MESLKILELLFARPPRVMHGAAHQCFDRDQAIRGLIGPKEIA